MATDEHNKADESKESDEENEGSEVVSPILYSQTVSCCPISFVKWHSYTHIYSSLLIATTELQ
jgi:hypothetical protein